VIVWTPALSVEVVKVAVPLLITPVPRVVEPSRKVTMPVTPVGAEDVKVTDWLTVDGFSEDVRRMVGVSLLTICVVVPVAGPLFVSPP
jgi:hypothetical protein